jgi:hypothetical protein
MNALLATYRMPPVITLRGDPVVVIALHSRWWSDPGQCGL